MDPVSLQELPKPSRTPGKSQKPDIQNPKVCRKKKKRNKYLSIYIYICFFSPSLSLSLSIYIYIYMCVLALLGDFFLPPPVCLGGPFRRLSWLLVRQFHIRKTLTTNIYGLKLIENCITNQNIYCCRVFFKLGLDSKNTSWDLTIPHRKLCIQSYSQVCRSNSRSKDLFKCYRINILK